MIIEYEYIGGRCNIFSVGETVLLVCGRCFGCECRGVGGRNMNNDSAANRCQKRCFTTFIALFYVYTFSYVTLNCLIVFFLVEFE